MDSVSILDNPTVESITKFASLLNSKVNARHTAQIKLLTDEIELLKKQRTILQHEKSTCLKSIKHIQTATIPEFLHVLEQKYCSVINRLRYENGQLYHQLSLASSMQPVSIPVDHLSVPVPVSPVPVPVPVPVSPTPTHPDATTPIDTCDSKASSDDSFRMDCPLVEAGKLMPSPSQSSIATVQEDFDAVPSNDKLHHTSISLSSSPFDVDECMLQVDTYGGKNEAADAQAASPLRDRGGSGHTTVDSESSGHSESEDAAIVTTAGDTTSNNTGTTAGDTTSHTSTGTTAGDTTSHTTGTAATADWNPLDIEVILSEASTPEKTAPAPAPVPAPAPDDVTYCHVILPAPAPAPAPFAVDYKTQVYQLIPHLETLTNNISHCEAVIRLHESTQANLYVRLRRQTIKLDVTEKHVSTLIMRVGQLEHRVHQAALLAEMRSGFVRWRQMQQTLDIADDVLPEICTTRNRVRYSRIPTGAVGAGVTLQLAAVTKECQQMQLADLESRCLGLNALASRRTNDLQHIYALITRQFNNYPVPSTDSNVSTKDDICVALTSISEQMNSAICDRNHFENKVNKPIIPRVLAITNTISITNTMNNYIYNCYSHTEQILVEGSGPPKYRPPVDHFPLFPAVDCSR